MFPCSAVFGVDDGVGESNKFARSPFWLCLANIGLSDPELSGGFAMDAGFSDSLLVELNVSDGSRRFREKVRAVDESSFLIALVLAASN
jgi:hypothetical protein